MGKEARTKARVGTGKSDGELKRPLFVGRDAERRALDSALDRARRFQAPQLVTVVGALGMGKTRLLDEWLLGVWTAGGVRIVRAAAPDPAEAGPQEPFALIGAALRARFGITGEPDGDALGTLRAEMGRVFQDRRVSEMASLLSRFLGLEAVESPLAQTLSARPEHEIDLARAVLCRFLEQDSAKQPMVLVLDGLQFADDGSLDVLAKLPGELGEAPLCVVGAARPELLLRRPEWWRGDGSHVRIELGPLCRPEQIAFIRATLATDSLAAGLAERAQIESGGNPFLLEQLLRVYRQHGMLVAETAEAWTFDAMRAGREHMVMTVEEAAQARIGALTAAERDVLARGAATGSTFWTGCVVALGRIAAEPLDPTAVFAPDQTIDEIRRTLGSLAERDYLVMVASAAVPGETEWAFKHPLERGLVAGAVDPELQRVRKRFAAQWLETRLGAGRDDRLELLGGLYEEGGDGRRAAYCLVTAADQARERLRLERARGLYLRGVRLLDVDDAIAKMDALFKLGDVAARIGRAREALGHFNQMLRLAWRLDLPAKGGAAHDRIGRLHRALGEYRRAQAHLGLARQLFEVAGDLPGIASVLDDIGRVHLLTGNPLAAMDCHRRALAVRDRIGDRLGRSLTLAWMGQVEREAGDLQVAARHFAEALDLRRAAGDRAGIVACLYGLGGIERDLGHGEKAIAMLEEARRMAEKLGERLSQCRIEIEIGDCRLSEGKPRDALKLFKRAKEMARRFAARRLLAEATRGAAEAMVSLGLTLDARDEARAALEIADSIGSPPLRGAALRVLASAVGLGVPGDAELGGAREMFDKAIEVLEIAGAELELGRALAAYAEFEERTGRESAARDLRKQADSIRDRARASGRRRVLTDSAGVAAP